jgi:hypothetical protein
MTDPGEQRARRRRLVVIVVAWIVVIAGFVTWRVVTDRAVDDRSDTIEAQLRRVWRDVDLVDLQDRVDAAQLDDDETGRNSAFALFPQPADGKFFSGGFVGRNELVARYTVETDLAGHGCVAIRVRGPAPNRLTFARSGDC